MILAGICVCVCAYVRWVGFLCYHFPYISSPFFIRVELKCHPEQCIDLVVNEKSSANRLDGQNFSSQCTPVCMVCGRFFSHFDWPFAPSASMCAARNRAFPSAYRSSNTDLRATEMQTDFNHSTYRTDAGHFGWIRFASVPCIGSFATNYTHFRKSYAHH